MMQSVEQLQSLISRCEKQRKAHKMRLEICSGGGCTASGALQVAAALEAELDERNLRTMIESVYTDDGCGGSVAVGTGCQGFCEKGPLVRVQPGSVLYTHVTPDDAVDIVDGLVNHTIVERLLYRNPTTKKSITKESDVPFYKLQEKITLRNCGYIAPDEVNEYLATGGYQGLIKALQMGPEAAIAEVLQSNLRGRGGGGFPAGRKWSIAAGVSADQKYIICNADEGDPGAFMDRSVMEGDPHRLLEGMMIAGFAIGASVGYIYVRAEYPLAIDRLEAAIAEAEALGLLGKNILGSGFSFNLRIKEGAGAFVCGEESALISSIEGRRGMPKPKPPFPAVSGLFGKPTVINNVETLANIPDILHYGHQWFRSLGTDASPGTKTFALSGDVENTGLVEVPMGTSLRQLVFDIGGGIRGGQPFKAVQIGGPSGGCLTEAHLDLPVDFDSLQSVGAMVGSGGLVVMDANTCIVEVARFFMNFTQMESCGKCVPCREGTRRMLEILQKIVEGRGSIEDLDHLQEIGAAVRIGSLCGLGKTAPNPVLSTMELFRKEYLSHVVDKRCPAGVCKGLRRYLIDEQACKGCSRCAKACPVDAISGTIRQPYTIDQDSCIKCGACKDVCNFDAVEEVA